MLGFRSKHIPSVLDDVGEDIMTLDLAVTRSSGGGTKSRGSGGAVVGAGHP
jgi:hypothetical protein